MSDLIKAERNVLKICSAVRHAKLFCFRYKYQITYVFCDASQCSLLSWNTYGWGNIFPRVYIGIALFKNWHWGSLLHVSSTPCWGLNCLSYEWTNGKTYKAQFGTSEWQFLYVIHLSISQIHPSIYRKIYHFFLLLRQSIYTHYMDYFYFKQSTLYNFNIYAKLFIRLNVSFSRERVKTSVGQVIWVEQ